jgi:hypothetical protein
MSWLKPSPQSENIIKVAAVTDKMAVPTSSNRGKIHNPMFVIVSDID